ncbi:Hypothetical_protein [Hexamita inflata]|uniref:Hypothetical_protein n=1 Tax=Hexamita inflata TaxID=28002 RepID=A0AA86PRI3_9EUKA|nr:Hypothetical protein HINF_LOCUS32479 [Hexamita inflata]
MISGYQRDKRSKRNYVIIFKQCCYFQSDQLSNTIILRSIDRQGQGHAINELTGLESGNRSIASLETRLYNSIVQLLQRKYLDYDEGDVMTSLDDECKRLTDQCFDLAFQQLNLLCCK